MWQWAGELLAFVLGLVFSRVIAGFHRIVDKLLLLTYVNHVFVVQPTFYLFGDSQFRIDVMNRGFWMALINALKQKYD